MSSIAPQEIAQFSANADDWWNPDGKFRPLHRLNPVRVEYVRDQACAHFSRDPQSRQSLKGLSVLDVGCGGGLLAEPMTRMGANVTAIDASAETITIAAQHAKLSRLSIDYRISSVEELAQSYSPPLAGGVRGGGHPQEALSYDLITALEVAEHVADMDTFLNGLKKLLKPDGLLIMSTLNRTAKSFLLGIVAAEYILGWVPRGTHQWKKFIRPSELVTQLQDRGLATSDLTGLVFKPLTGAFELSRTDLDVNYLLTASVG